MLAAYKEFWKNYVNFEGRSTRPQYWFVVLINFFYHFSLPVNLFDHNLSLVVTNAGHGSVLGNRFGRNDDTDDI